MRLLRDRQQRDVTFRKRMVGCMKKVLELHILCGVEIGLFVFIDGKMHVCSSHSPEDIANKFRSYEGDFRHVTPKQFADLQPDRFRAKQVWPTQYKHSTKCACSTSTCSTSRRGSPSGESKRSVSRLSPHPQHQSQPHPRSRKRRRWSGDTGDTGGDLATTASMDTQERQDGSFSPCERDADAQPQSPVQMQLSRTLTTEGVPDSQDRLSPTHDVSRSVCSQSHSPVFRHAHSFRSCRSKGPCSPSTVKSCSTVVSESSYAPYMLSDPMGLRPHVRQIVERSLEEQLRSPPLVSDSTGEDSESFLKSLQGGGPFDDSSWLNAEQNGSLDLVDIGESVSQLGSILRDRPLNFL
ncbi:hypothetical protein AAMO2058_000287300 [Amorphochlora amoebiformis]|eukprot:1395271-Amorphochlora_amoeboformis.AAC.3